MLGLQIRLHLAHIGHPILGDDMYGLMVRSAHAGLSEKECCDCSRNVRKESLSQVDWAPRQMLHATVLSFDHPVNEQPVTITGGRPSSITGDSST